MVGETISSTLETFETENILIQWVVSPQCLGFTHPTLETNFKKKKSNFTYHFGGTSPLLWNIHESLVVFAFCVLGRA